MDCFSIFASAQTTWDEFVACFSKIINVEGVDDSDEFGKRHVWKALGFEFIGINNPDLDDDQGIPFSTFNFQIDLLASDVDNPKETSRFSDALARFLVVRMRKVMNEEFRLVKNLQVSVPVE